MGPGPWQGAVSAIRAIIELLGGIEAAARGYFPLNHGVWVSGRRDDVAGWADSSEEDDDMEDSDGEEDYDDSGSDNGWDSGSEAEDTSSDTPELL